MSTLYRIFAPPTLLIMVPSSYLELQIFSASLQVILTNRYSINSCNIGMPMGAGELRVFLLYHLGHSLHICVNFIIMFHDIPQEDKSRFIYCPSFTKNQIKL